MTASRTVAAINAAALAVIALFALVIAFVPCFITPPRTQPMEKPRTLTDIRIAFPCPSCSGHGRTGSTDCSYCQGTGWEIRDAAYLKPPELKRLLAKLPSRRSDP